MAYHLQNASYIIALVCFWANLGLVQSPIELEVLCFDAALCSFVSAASCKWCISL